MTAGSDSHHHKGVGYAYTEADVKTIDDFKNAIINKKTRGLGKKAPIYQIFTPFLSKMKL